MIGFGFGFGFSVQGATLLNQYPTISNIVVSAVTDTGFVVTADIDPKGTLIPVLNFGLTTAYGTDINATEGEITEATTCHFTVTGLTHYTFYQYKLTAGLTATNNRYIVPATEVATTFKTWGLKNLNISITPMGYEIPEVQLAASWAALTTPGWCNAGNSAVNGGVYGKLYNFYAIKKIQEDIDTYNALHPDAPFVYDLSISTDWDGIVAAYGGATVAGQHLKEVGTTHWGIGNTGDNTSGLTLLPGGYRTGSGTFGDINNYGLYYHGDNNTTRGLRQNNSTVALNLVSGASNIIGAYVRMIKSDRVAPAYKPDVTTIESTDVETLSKILFIDSADNLYGTDGFRAVIKATQLNLSDAHSVCTLPSQSSLRTFKLISAVKGVGFVQGLAADQGMYCFDNAGTETWTARKTGTMAAGFPATEFQGFANTPDFSHLWMCEYGIKDTNPAPVNVYMSTDAGETWAICYTHSVTTNTHIHAIEWDAFINRLWVLIGDEGASGKPGWAYSDDYGSTFSFVENNDATGQIPFMDTAIIPTADGLLTGSDYLPAGIRQWKPTAKIAEVVVSNADVKTLRFLTSRYAGTNLGYARKPLADLASTPYRLAMSFIYNAAYSGGQLLISPDGIVWYNVENITDPLTQKGFERISGITSTGYVIGWSTYTGTAYHRYFKFPNWVINDNH